MSHSKEELHADAPPPGTILAGKYRVDGLLGAGGMGYVLAATHLQLGERVAIKMILPALSRDAEVVGRFLREARAALRIKSEHCVRIQDVGELPDRTPYMVMEYLEGEDLGHLLDSRGTIPVSLAVDYVLEACEALAEAHALKIVHRDLKPSNLFVQRAPNGFETIKVLDFGISKMETASSDQMVMTRTMSVMGSPLYMSPEQMKSAKVVDERADQWAIGVILFELIAGRPPFVAETLPELGALVLSGEAPSLSSYAPIAPPGLSAVVATCLRRNANDRFVNLADFADVVAPFGSEKARHSSGRVTQVLGMPLRRAHVYPGDASRVVQTGDASSPDFAIGGPATASVVMQAAQPSLRSQAPLQAKPPLLRYAGLTALCAIVGSVMVGALLYANRSPAPAAAVPIVTIDSASPPSSALAATTVDHAATPSTSPTALASTATADASTAVSRPFKRPAGVKASPVATQKLPAQTAVPTSTSPPTHALDPKN